MVIKVKYNGEWVKIPYLSSDHGRELVEEAPKDGKQYARQNGVWSVVNIPEIDFTEVYKALMNDGKYRKLPVYGRNLLLGSGKEVSNSKYEMADYWLTEPISKGTQVTLTIFGELGDDKEMFTIYNSTGVVGSMAQFSKADFVNGKASKTFKWITNIGDNESNSEQITAIT